MPVSEAGSFSLGQTISCEEPRIAHGNRAVRRLEETKRYTGETLPPSRPSGEYYHAPVLAAW
jgi:hypothetical protein